MLTAQHHAQPMARSELSPGRALLAGVGGAATAAIGAGPGGLCAGIFLQRAGIDDVLIGRVRETVGRPGGISLWVVGDILRKGAALNAVQIAELIVG